MGAVLRLTRVDKILVVSRLSLEETTKHRDGRQSGVLEAGRRRNQNVKVKKAVMKKVRRSHI